MSAEAVVEFKTKHGVQILAPPDAIHTEFLQAWDRVAVCRSERNPLFKEIYEFLRR